VQRKVQDGIEVERRRVRQLTVSLIWCIEEVATHMGQEYVSDMCLKIDIRCLDRVQVHLKGKRGRGDSVYTCRRCKK